jgi:hypothetical protein
VLAPPPPPPPASASTPPPLTSRPSDRRRILRSVTFARPPNRCSAVLRTLPLWRVLTGNAVAGIIMSLEVPSITTSSSSSSAHNTSRWISCRRGNAIASAGDASACAQDGRGRSWSQRAHLPPHVRPRMHHDGGRRAITIACAIDGRVDGRILQATRAGRGRRAHCCARRTAYMESCAGRQASCLVGPRTAAAAGIQQPVDCGAAPLPTPCDTQPATQPPTPPAGLWEIEREREKVRAYGGGATPEWVRCGQPGPPHTQRRRPSVWRVPQRMRCHRTASRGSLMPHPRPPSPWTPRADGR